MGVEFNSNRIIECGSINELSVLYDMPTKILDDGSCWARIFYHNNKSGTKLFSSTDPFATQAVIKDEDRYSRLNLIPNFSANGTYEFILDYPDDYPGQYNRWKQTSNPVTTNNAVSGYSPIHIDWNGVGWGGLNKSTSASLCFLDGTPNNDNWHFSVGTFSSWNGGIPGRDVVTKGGQELWIRYDNVALFNATGTQIYGNVVTTKEFIEN